MLTPFNKTILRQLVFSTGSRISSLMLPLERLAVTKDRPQLNKAELKTLQLCLSMQVLLPPPEIKVLNENHIYSPLPKQTANPAPLDLHASTCRKNGGMLHSLSRGKHTGQTKHDFQNILGCVRLSDLAKTSSLVH